jgi:hypothetical protein
MAPTGDPAAMGRQDLRKKRETTMYVSMTGKAQSEQSRVNATWEKRMDSSIQEILELLAENVNWWEQAADTCEHTATRFPTGEKEGWQLMGAVYRERAEKHNRLVEQFRGGNNSAHG